jgi:DNA-binding XRE family transcriptional regulator
MIGPGHSHAVWSFIYAKFLRVSMALVRNFCGYILLPMKPNELRSRRLTLELSQTQLSKIFGVSLRTIQAWEAGLAPIRPIVTLAMERLTQIANEIAAENSTISARADQVPCA